MLLVDLVHLIVFYAFLGGAIKFIDQAYDEKAFSVRSAKVLAVLAGVLMGYLMAQDSPFSTAFFAAMLISLVIARKIDNFAFATGTVLAVATFAALYPQGEVVFLIVPMAAFLLAGVVDEVADDMVDRREMPYALRLFLNYRPFSDLALLGMVLAGLFPWVCFLPYFAFTLSYMFVERFSGRELRLYDRVSRLRPRMRMPRLDLLRPFR